MHLDFTYKELDYITVQDIVKLNWSKIWAIRGHTLGEGMLSPDQQYFYLAIPKNSSSSIKEVLKNLGWQYSNIESAPASSKVIVVLRDPIRRWISGISEYLMMYQQNTVDNIVEPNIYNFMPLLGDKLGLSLIFDRMTFDDHTERQCVFLNNVPFNRCIWFKSGPEFSQTFSSFLNTIGYQNNFVQAKKENSTENGNEKKKQLQDFISYVIDNDEYKKYNLTQWFWCDTELINTVNFYDPR
jgi:hypothetical protein